MAAAPSRPGLPVGNRSSTIRRVANGSRQLLPVEARHLHVEIPVGIALLAGRGTYRVERFLHQQGLVSGNQVTGQERLFEVARELISRNFHAGKSPNIRIR
jgi:hypothetical protein